MPALLASTLSDDAALNSTSIGGADIRTIPATRPQPSAALAERLPRHEEHDWRAQQPSIDSAFGDVVQRAGRGYQQWLGLLNCSVSGDHGSSGSRTSGRPVGIQTRARHGAQHSQARWTLYYVCRPGKRSAVERHNVWPSASSQP